jgi:DNA-binding Lrp family transcriptional regulator
MELSSKDREILACAYFQADAPISLIAKQTGYREHVVRASLNKMLEAGIIARYAIINPYAFGFADYYISFSFSTQNAAARKRALEALQNAEEVTFLAEVGGQFQYGASIFVRQPIDVLRFFDKISGDVGSVLVDKKVSTVLSLTHFVPGYLSPKRAGTATLGFSSAIKPSPIDLIDHKILRGIVDNRHSSRSALARDIGIPATTLDYRLKTLSERGILVGTAYFLKTALLVNYHPFVIEISFAQHSEQLRAQVIKFCQKEGHVHYHADSIGQTDCEIAASFEHPHLINDFVEKLAATFKTQISSVRHYPILRRLKLQLYPFRKFPAA